MYDFEWDLPFAFGLNQDTFAFIFNVGIPIVYFLCFGYLYYKLRNFEKDAPFYDFVKSLVYFFFFYGLGAAFFVWYDFFYMDFVSANPLPSLINTFDPVQPGLTISMESVQLWKIGNLLQNVGLLLMLNQLRGKVFKKKFMNVLPVVWQLIGMTSMILMGLVIFQDSPEETLFWSEVNYLFNFVWSISLPLTYRIIYKNSAGNLKRYAGILYVCLIIYGLSWGFRTRFAVHLFFKLFGWLGPANPFDYRTLWLIRAVMVDINIFLVFIAYRKLLATFK